MHIFWDTFSVYYWNTFLSPLSYKQKQGELIIRICSLIFLSPQSIGLRFSFLQDLFPLLQYELTEMVLEVWGIIFKLVQTITQRIGSLSHDALDLAPASFLCSKCLPLGFYTFLPSRATTKDNTCPDLPQAITVFLDLSQKLSLYLPCFQILKVLDGASWKRRSLLGWLTVCCFPMCQLASSGCQQLEFDALMVLYKFVNAGHTCPPGIMYCDFQDIGNLVNMVAKHDREWNTVSAVMVPRILLFHYGGQRSLIPQTRLPMD